MTRFATEADFRRFRRLRQRVLKRDRFVCRYCSIALIRCAHHAAPRPDNAATVDHVIPLARGGRSEAANLVACCHGCNVRKGVNAPSFLGAPA